MVNSELRRRFQEEEQPDTIISINNGASTEHKPPLKIDFESIFASDRDEPPMELIIVPSASAGAAGDGDQCRESPAKKKKKKPVPNSSSSLHVVASGGDVALMSAHELKSAIARNVCTIASYGENFPDKGAKLKVQLKRLEEELELRRFTRVVDFMGALRRHKQVTPSYQPSEGTYKQAATFSQPPEQSKFATCFLKKLENDVKQNSELKTGDQAINAFENEISYLSLHNKLKRKPMVQIPESKSIKPALCSKQLSSWKPNKRSRNTGKYMSLDGFLARAASIGSLLKGRLAGSFTMRDASETLNLNGSKNEKDIKQGQTVVLVDEEEPEHAEAGRKQEAEELSLSGKIYYPSRDDPESLQIFHSELKCLQCGECLTSTIMNFYMRFLQEFLTQMSQSNFYFFNTYFYSKLQEAVAYKNSDREAFFIKFRRWWKGVNIFQKAYIFLPINEDNHWSLVIICIPDKEDESGPTILHLDSLGLHSSISIFDNIKGLLKNEWEYLSQDDAVLDTSISDRIWKRLPHLIEQKIVEVPRQTNDYDCGLFVLYYMERFIQDAPDRLKQLHLTMFGKKWFKPREASSLRWKIKNMLQEEFRKTLREGNSALQPVSLTGEPESSNHNG